jgi:hypothetical protein
MEKKCKACVNRHHCHEDIMSWVYFIIGLISIVAIRIPVFFDVAHPSYGKIAWYIGVIGFLLFFLYQYKVAKQKTCLIDGHDLLVKMNDPHSLSPGDYERIRVLLCSMTSFKDKANFAFIFIVSALSLAWAVYVDFIKR